MMSNCADISFENINVICKKCTPRQMMSFQISLKLHKLLNEINQNCTTNIVCTSRRTTFEILRNNNVKIGMDTTTNKLFHINKQIGLNALNLEFDHFKKLCKFSPWKMVKHNPPLKLKSLTCLLGVHDCTSIEICPHFPSYWNNCNGGLILIITSVILMRPNKYKWRYYSIYQYTESISMWHFYLYLHQ